MISASITTFSHYNLKNLRPKVMQNIANLRKKFCEFPPYWVKRHFYEDEKFGCKIDERKWIHLILRSCFVQLFVKNRSSHFFILFPIHSFQFSLGSCLRPCIRQNFLNFLFSRVSKMFVCRSLEIFWKKQIFCKKVQILTKIVRQF